MAGFPTTLCWSLFNYRIVLAKGQDFKIGPQCPEGENHGYGSHWVPLHDGRADSFSYAVWNIAKIRTARSKSLVQLDPSSADELPDWLLKFLEDKKSSQPMP
jgi:hypothetical protein